MNAEVRTAHLRIGANDLGPVERDHPTVHQHRDPFREVYRTHRMEHATSLPPYRPTDGQRANMTALLALLDGAPEVDFGEVAGLHRELGDFERAAEAVEKAVPNYWGETIAPLLGRLIARRVNAPVRYRPGW